MSAESTGDTPPDDGTDFVEARATINLQGLKAGERATVDRSLPYIAMLFERGILVAD